MNVQYDSLIIQLFTGEQLRRYQERYYASEHLTIFDIAREMRADAQEVLNSFDFLEFAESLLRQAEPGDLPAQLHQAEQQLLRRI